MATPPAQLSAAGPATGVTDVVVIDQRAFRDALGCFATGVCVATTRDAAGAPVGVTVNSFTSVSLDPPLVLFCLDREAVALAAFSRAEAFAFTILAADQRPLSDRFARLPVEERFAGVDWMQGDTGAPLLPGGLATLECVPHATHDGGDHVILVGRVVAISSRPGAPLLYVRGGYAGVAG